MHGGAVSLVFDMCTTMAAAPAASKDWWEFGGVSRGLSLTFLRPIARGTEVLIECEVLQMSRRYGERSFAFEAIKRALKEFSDDSRPYYRQGEFESPCCGRA